MYEQTKKEHPNAKITELTKIISEKWRDVDEDTKRKYENQNAEVKKKYEKEKKDYEDKYGKPEKKSKKKKAAKAEGTANAGKKKTKK